MNPHLPSLRCLCSALLATTTMACTGTPAATESPLPLLAQIERGAADAACDNAQQCHSIAIGAKACGGPERYLAWSSKHNDGARLRKLAEQYAAERMRQDKDSGMMSTCSLVTDPGATCQAGRCILLQRGLGNGAAKEKRAASSSTRPLKQARQRRACVYYPV